jgi:uncharacterized protein
MSNISKRDFLKKITVAGIAGTALPAGLKAEKKETETLKKKPIIRIMGRTGYKVPVISSGALSWGNINLVKEIFKSGIKHFDSALVYGDSKNDEVIGNMLKEFGSKKFIIASKVVNEFDFTEKKFKSDNIEKEFFGKLDRILKAMQVETLDILYVHDTRCKEQVLNPEVMAAAEKAKKEGKAKFIGVTAHENIYEVFKAACDAKIYDVVLGSYNFRSGQDVKDAFALANKEGLGTVAMKTQAGGFLDKEKTKAVNLTAAIKYVLQDENVHTVIKGIYSFDDLNKLMEMSANLEMTEEEKQNLKDAQQYAGLYCKGCTVCRPMCPKKLSIPDLMRAYMYTYGYGEPSRGKELVIENNITENTCDDCEVCTVKCAMGFPVKERIRDIARLRNIPGDFLV